jgi:hypothetical protein
MIAEGEDGFLAVGVRVHSSSNGGGETTAALVADAFTVVLVPPVDVPVVNELIRSHAPAEALNPAYPAPGYMPGMPGYMPGMRGNPMPPRGAGGYPYQALPRGAAGYPYQARPQMRQMPYSMSNISDAKFAAAADGADDGAEFPKTPVREYHAKLTPDGHLTGRIQVLDARTGLPAPVSGGQVFAIQNGSTVGEGVIDSRGMFDIARMPAGAVSFVATAPEGFAACTIVIGNHAAPQPIMPRPVNDTGSQGQIREVSMAQGATVLSLDCAVVPYSMFPLQLVPLEEAMMMSGCCGGSMGGGGGCCGGLGWLGLAGLAGLAGLGNHGSTTTTVVIPSPATP